GAYSYSLNGGTAQSSNTFTGLTAGTFTVVVSDANGCSFNVSNIIIANPSQLTATANASSQVSCNNAADGYITINAQGGTGAYSYSLNGGTAQSSNTFSGLTAGTYSVVVSDANGCSYTLNNILISNPSQLTATANASSQVSCNNAADGYITITAQGGTGAYSYSLNGGTAQSSNTFTGLTAGTFTVVVSDANGCSFNVSNIIIANPSQLTATANVSSQVSCNNAADGYITITAQGGTGAYSYSLNGGAAQSSNTFSGLTAGTYSVVVSDANGCSNQIFVNLNNPEPLNVTYHTYCKTGHVGIEILANGGNGVYQYSINGGSTYSSEHIFDNLPINDTLQLVVTDGNNCMSATYEVPVVNLNTLSANVSILNQNLCFNSNDASVAINAQGGVPPYSYYLNNQPLNNNIVSQLSSGNYEVYIHDSNGCPFYTSFEITQATPISVEIVNMVNPDCYLNSYGQAQISVQGGTPPYQITWSNGDSGFESNLLSPGINQIWVKDLNGCEIEKSLNVQMNTVVVLPSINNVFTPNGDGINETWEIDNLEQFKENELFIYNRWGNEVYTTKNYSNNWNGSDLNEGTYFYILKLKVCDEWQEYSGYITILR
ncbi:MAG: gliding motility-associated C-terminal domain-containing protein, partial [Bacteroidales bacterium]|nr:gliding motility-associated C-terminal domain-containing protein [Bacteroidales bacterium]